MATTKKDRKPVAYINLINGRMIGNRMVGHYERVPISELTPELEFQREKGLIAIEWEG